MLLSWRRMKVGVWRGGVYILLIEQRGGVLSPQRERERERARERERERDYRSPVIRAFTYRCTAIDTPVYL